MFKKDKPAVPKKKTPINAEISFKPEEIVKVMSDIKVTIPISDEAHGKILDLVAKYDNQLPKILVVLESTHGDINMVNFQLFMHEVNLMEEKQ